MLVLEIEIEIEIEILTERLFDHDRLDVCRLSVDWIASALDASRSLERLLTETSTETSSPGFSSVNTIGPGNTGQHCQG